MTKIREQQIRKIVRQQLVFYIDEALGGDEHLMKEVWEDCDDEAELKVADAELKVIKELLQAAKAQ